MSRSIATLPRPSPEFPLYDAEEAYEAHVRATSRGVTDQSISHDLCILKKRGELLAEYAITMADSPRHTYWITYWLNDRPTAERLIETGADDLIDVFGPKGAEVVRKAARLRLAQAEGVQA